VLKGVALFVLGVVDLGVVDRRGIELHQGRTAVVEGARKHAVTIGAEAVVGEDGLDA